MARVQIGSVGRRDGISNRVRVVFVVCCCLVGVD